MTHVAKLHFNGDPNIGLYGVATDKFVILGRSVFEKHVKLATEVFKVPVIQANIYGTPLVGIFVAATSKVVLVPDVIFENELAYLKQQLAPLKVEVKTIKTEHTALGNNLAINDKTGFASTEFANIKEIEKILKIKLKVADFAETNTPGSIGVVTNKGAVFSSDLSDKEIKLIEKQLGFEIGIGSINMGSPRVASGVIANSNGFFVGSLSSGWEIGRVEESLGFLR